MISLSTSKFIPFRTVWGLIFNKADISFVEGIFVSSGYTPVNIASSSCSAIWMNIGFSVFVEIMSIDFWKTMKKGNSVQIYIKEMHAISSNLQSSSCYPLFPLVCYQQKRKKPCQELATIGGACTLDRAFCFLYLLCKRKKATRPRCQNR